MGVKVEKSINSGVTKEVLRAKVGKLDNFDSIFDRFDTNNDGKLDESEQVGMMALLNQLSGGDGKLTKKDMQNADTSDLGQNITYKDMKKFVNAYNSLLKKDSTKQTVTTSQTQAEGSDKSKTQYTAGNRTYTVDDNNRIATKKDGNVTTEYTYGKDNNISVQTETDGTKGAEKTTTSNYSYGGASSAQQLKTQTIEDRAAGTRTEITYTDTGRDQTITDKKTGVKTEEVYRGDDIQTRKVTDNRNNQTQVTTTQFKSYNGSRVADQSQTVTTTGNSRTTTDITYSTDGTTQLFGRSHVVYTQNGDHNTVASLNGLGGEAGHIREQNTTFNYNGATQVLTSSSIVFDDDSSENPHTMVQGYNSDGTLKTTSVKNGKKSTEIKYSGGSATETVRDAATGIDITRTYSTFDAKTGSVAHDKMTQEVETNKNTHVRTTKTFENGVQGPVTKYEQLDTANNQVVMTSEVDTKTRSVTYKAGNKTVKMNLSKDGKYTMAVAKWLGTRMETVREAAKRLGYSDSDIAAIEKANGGNRSVSAGGSIKIPIGLTLDKGAGTSFEAASKIDASEQLKAKRDYDAEQARIKAEAEKAKIVSKPLKEDDTINWNNLKFKEGKEEEGKQTVKKALSAMDMLRDENNIVSATSIDPQTHKAKIYLKDGSVIACGFGYYNSDDESKRNTITDIYYYPAGSNKCTVSFNHDNKVGLDGSLGEVSQNGVVKNWDTLKTIAENALSKEKPEFIDYGKLEYNEGALGATTLNIDSTISALASVVDTENIDEISGTKDNNGTISIKLRNNRGSLQVKYNGDKIESVAYIPNGTSNPSVTLDSSGKISNSGLKNGSIADAVKNWDKLNEIITSAIGKRDEVDANRTQRLQSQSSRTEYSNERLKKEAADLAARKGYQATNHSFIFFKKYGNSNTYYYYNPEEGEFKTLGYGIFTSSVNAKGNVIDNNGHEHLGDAIVTATRLHAAASSHSSDTSVGYMTSIIKNNVTKDNVVEIWNASKSIKGSYDNDLLNMLCSENCTYGDDGGRAKACDATKHIVKALIDRAIAKNSSNSNNPAVTNGNNFINGNSFNFDLYKKSSDFDDQDLYNAAKPVINDLLSLF